jgi:hypothetical protein
VNNKQPLGLKIISGFFIIWGIDRILYSFIFYNFLNFYNWFGGHGVWSAAAYKIGVSFLEILIGLIFCAYLLILGICLLRLRNWARELSLILPILAILIHWIFYIPIDPFSDAVLFRPIILLLTPYLALMNVTPLILLILIACYYFYLLSPKTIQMFKLGGVYNGRIEKGKKNLRINIGLSIGIIIWFICLGAIYISRLSFHSTKSKPEEILKEWLIEKDPELFSRCKVFLHEGDSEYSIIKEGKYTKITGMLCGDIASFWVNTQTKTVDCYISYCGKHIGKKYCGIAIADRACDQ